MIDPGGLTPAQRTLLEARLRGRAITARRTVAALHASSATSAPLSAEQEQLYVHARLQPGHPLYNEAVFIAKDGHLDVGALREAVNLFVRRHDIWHTTFRRVEGAVQQVVEPSIRHEVPLHDVSGLPPEEQRRRVRDIVATQAGARYDLAVGPLVRPLIIRYDDETHRLYLGLHHIIFDGVCLYRVVFPELVELYAATSAGRAPSLPAVRIQYPDYARWQHGGALDATLGEHLPYWRDHLRNAPQLRLPTVVQRREELPRRGTMIGFDVGADTVATARKLASRTNATLMHVLVAAYTQLLHLLTGDDDIVFATVADLRRRAELESMVGYCLTPLPLRIRTAGIGSFPALVGAVRDELLNTLDHLVPFERLVRDLRPPAVPGSSPVFQAMFVLEPQSPSTIGDWTLHQLDPDIGQAIGSAKLDFQMELDERSDGRLAGRFCFNANLFQPTLGHEAVSTYLGILSRLSFEPDQPPSQRRPGS